MDNRLKTKVREICIFSMLGALMFITKFIMQWIPNVHLLSLFIASVTLIYRWKALIPIYLYVFLDGIFGGFSLWWFPYLYIWTVLWAAFMFIPKGINKKKLIVVSAVFCFLHGIFFGTLYAPFQAIVFHLNFKATLAWIIAGLPFDAIQAVSNLVISFLTVPLVSVICILDGKKPPYTDNYNI